MQPDISPKKYLQLPSIPYSADCQPKKAESITTGIGYSILTSQPIKNREVLAKVIADRVTFLQNAIDEITTQIQERQKLKEFLNSDIDEKLCHNLTKIYELEFWNIPTRARRRISLEQQVAELYKEKRQHEVLHWQDTVMLKRELRNAERELRMALRSQNCKLKSREDIKLPIQLIRRNYTAMDQNPIFQCQRSTF